MQNGQEPQSIDHDILRALLATVALKDRCTIAHTWRVALYTMALAEHLGLDRSHIERLVRGAVLHDLGKVDVPDAVLGKEGVLTEEEWLEIRRHPTLGYDRLVRMGEQDELVLNLVRFHHERMDGRGYPDGLAGDAIPMEARQFAVIDTFDAMTSIRPYRPQLDDRAVERAAHELHNAAGTQHCEVCVEAFTDLLASGRIDWIRHHFSDATQLQDLSHMPSVSAMDEVIDSRTLS